MRITILTVGSRGDVQPYVALGVGLKGAGHDVRLATHEPFRDFVASNGLEFAPLGADPKQILAGREGQSWLQSGDSLIRFVGRFLRLFRPLLERNLAYTSAACVGSEAIVYSPLAFAGQHVAEALGVPSYQAAVQPATPTREFPIFPLAGKRSWGGTYNRLSYTLYEQAAWQGLRAVVNRWRKEVLGLPKFPVIAPFKQYRESGVPHLYAFSAAVVPKPSDWPDWHHIAGYWFLDRPAAWQPSADIVDFLDAGPPPVYVGFGSMIAKDPAELFDVALAALRRTGQRGVLSTGWMGADHAHLPDDVFGIESIPHDWLFPKMKAVVHHGGAGTTAAGLRAGVPSVVTPFFADQPFWAHRVKVLGVGPPPVPQKRITAERLAAAIQTATSDDGMRARAASLGERIRADDGVCTAVGLVTQGG
jgi:UDP:flavonoid glycosyltransferase YjiC (YdhE family)